MVVGNDSAPTDVAPEGGFLASTGITGGDEVLLAGGRFAVAIAWRDFEGEIGVGTLAVRSEDSAVFWFFRESNWEMMVKVVDGCGFNDHFWVFAAATTNVETTLTVTDTLTGAVAVYDNPLGRAPSSVTDTAAFATCP